MEPLGRILNVGSDGHLLLRDDLLPDLLSKRLEGPSGLRKICEVLVYLLKQANITGPSVEDGVIGKRFDLDRKLLRSA